MRTEIYFLAEGNFVPSARRINELRKKCFLLHRRQMPLCFISDRYDEAPAYDVSTLGLCRKVESDLLELMPVQIDRHIRERMTRLVAGGDTHPEVCIHL